MVDEVKLSESSAPTKSYVKTLAEEQIQADIDIAGGVASYELMVAAQQDIDYLQALIGDPGPVTPDVFRFYIANNTTIGAVSPIPNTTFTHWQIAKDSSTQPTTNWTSGTTVTASYDLGDYDSHTLYLWVKDDNNGGAVTQIAPDSSLSDGETVPGLIIKANDTYGPLWGTVPTLSAGTDDETQIKINISVLPSDSGSGLDRIDLYQSTDDTLIKTDVSDADQISNLTSGETYYWYLKAIDNEGNSTDYVLPAYTTVGIDGGTIEFTGTYFEQDQDSSPLAVTLKRTGSSTGSVSVTVSTVDRTAIAGTNYTAISAQTVTFIDSDISETVNVTLNASPVLTTNDMFEIQIDYGSESGCSIGNVNSALCKINSSSAGVLGYQQQSSGNYILAVETDAPYTTIVPSIKTGYTAETYSVVGPSSRYSYSWPLPSSVGKILDAAPNAVDTTGYGDETSWDARGFYVRIPCSFADDSSHDVWLRKKASSGATRFSHITLERPVTSITGASPQVVTLDHDHGWTGTHEVFFENTTDGDSTASSSNTYTATVTGTNTFTIPGSSMTSMDAAACDAAGVICLGGDDSLGMYTADGSPSRYHWTHKDMTANADRVLTPFIGSTAYLRIYGVSYQDTADKVLLTPTSVSYDPTNVNDDPATTNDHGFGPDPSTYSATGTVVDNPDNPTAPSVPLPSTEQAATSLYPTDNSTNISVLGLVLQAEFAGTNITWEKFDVNVSGVPIDGTVFTSTTGDSGSEVSTIAFVCAAQLSPNTEYKVELLGTIRDTSNVLKKIEKTGDEWTFTTIDTGAVGTLAYVDFSAHVSTTSPHPYTNEEILVDFDFGDTGSTNIHNFGGGGDYNISGPNLGRLHIVDDPATNPTRGKVLRITAPGGNVVIGSCMNFAADFGAYQADPYDDSGPQTIYFSYDLFLTEAHVFVKQNKFPSVFTGTRLEASHGLTPAEAEGELAFSATPSLYGPTAWGVTAMATYIYGAIYVTADSFWDTVDDDINLYPNRDLSSNNPYVPTLGRWITIEQMVALDSPAGNGDAEIKVWVKDPVQWAGAKLVLNETAWNFTDVGAEMSINRLWMSMGYGGNSSDPNNRLDVTQYTYIDNIIVSTSRIT